MAAVKYLNKDEQGRFLEAVKKSRNIRDLCFYTLILRYGLRTREARELKVEHLKLKESSIYVQRAKKGISKYYPLREDDKRLIQKWLKERAGRPNADSPYLFITEKSKQLHRLTPIKAFERYAELAGITGHGVHSLRHSTAYNLLSGGVDLFDIKSWLGHSSINSTMVYLTLATGEQKARLQRVLDFA